MRGQLPADVLEYAASYQAGRHLRSESYDALFLPLEVLADRESGRAHLSVSFSGTAGRDVYVTQSAELIRAVRVTTRWFIIPWTVARVFTPDEFVATFAELLTTETVDGEPFWVFRAAEGARLKQTIGALELDGSFREQFEHGYLPEHDEGEVPGS